MFVFRSQLVDREVTHNQYIYYLLQGVVWSWLHVSAFLQLGHHRVTSPLSRKPYNVCHNIWINSYLFRHCNIYCLVSSIKYLWPDDGLSEERPKYVVNFKLHLAINMYYRVSIKSFPDYKHLLQENYVEYKHIFLPLLKLVSKILCHVFMHVCNPLSFLVINVCSQGKTLCSPCSCAWLLYLLIVPVPCLLGFLQ